MGEHKLIMGKDIFFWNFIILMFFTLFEVGAIFFEEYPGTDTRVSMYVVWVFSSSLESSKDSVSALSLCTFGMTRKYTFESHCSRLYSFC